MPQEAKVARTVANLAEQDTVDSVPLNRVSRPTLNTDRVTEKAK